MPPGPLPLDRFVPILPDMFQTLTDDELALVVAGTDVHGEVRYRTGMCGCGVLPGGDLHAAH